MENPERILFYFCLAQKLANRENPTYFIFDNTTDIILKRKL